MRIKCKQISLKSALYMCAFIAICAFQCEDDDCDQEYMSNLSHLEIEVENVKSVYQYPDTIWYKSEFSSIIELDNGQVLNIDGYECFIHQRILKVENDGHVIEGARSYDYIEEVGNIYYDTIQQGEPGLWTYQSFIGFNCINGQCRFKIGYVPKSEGLYAIETRWGGFYPDSENCGLNNEFRDNVVKPSMANLNILRSLGINKIILPDNSESGRWLSLDSDIDLIVINVK